MRSKCYLDSNVLIYYKDQNSDHHQKAIKIIQKLTPDKYKIYISPLVIDEFIHIFSHAVKLEKLTTDRTYAQLNKALNSILSFRHLEIVNPPTEKSKNKKVLGLMKDFKLHPRDAYHLLIMKENNIKEFATFDADFKKVFRDKCLKKLA